MLRLLVLPASEYHYFGWTVPINSNLIIVVFSHFYICSSKQDFSGCPVFALAVHFGIHLLLGHSSCISVLGVLLVIQIHGLYARISGQVHSGLYC